MMNKWIKKSFLVAIFLMLGILFSCKSPSKPDVPDTPVIPDDPIEEKEEFLISFCVLPEDEGSITATFDAKPVTSGITKIEKGKEVIFTLTIKDPNSYELDGWEGAVKNKDNPLIASLTVSKNTKVTAKLKKIKGEDTELIPPELRLEAIEVALIGEKNGGAILEDFKLLSDFKGDKAGPYETEEAAKTAYITLKMKIARPANGDFSIRVANKTTYIEPVAFSRSSEGDINYFENFNDLIILSKGRNILEVKIKSPDNSKECTYTVIVKYDGGPDPLALEFENRKIIPGIYCPAQRKPLNGESPDLVWMIVIAGW